MKRTPAAALLLSIAVAFAATPAFAAQTLTPLPRNVADYASIVPEGLKDIFAPGVLASVVITPSFEPVYAVGIDRDHQGHYRIFTLRPLPKPASRCDFVVPERTALGLVEVWRMTLRRVSVQPVDRQIDATRYDFSMAVDGRRLAGEAMSADFSTPPGKLRAIADVMRSMCQTQASGWVSTLDDLTADLQRQLKSENMP
jgi:hypothetical protein